MANGIRKPLLERLGKEWLFFDGGTGTILQEKGLKGGELPEEFVTRFKYCHFISRFFQENLQDLPDIRFVVCGIDPFLIHCL